MISYSGGLRGFEQSQPFFSANGILAVLIAAVVQSYSALRLYQLQTEKSFVVPALCWVASLLRIFIYVGAVAHEVNPRSFAHTTRFWRIFLMFVGILALFSDLLMGLGLSKELYARRHNLALRESQALALEADLSYRRRSTSLVIDRFILLCISTNLMTCLCTLAAVVLFYASKGMYWMPVSYLSCRLFSICFITLVLQSRRLETATRYRDDLGERQLVMHRITSRPPLVAPKPIFYRSRQTNKVKNVATLPTSEGDGRPPFLDLSTTDINTIETEYLSADS